MRTLEMNEMISVSGGGTPTPPPPPPPPTTGTCTTGTSWGDAFIDMYEGAIALVVHVAERILK